MVDMDAPDTSGIDLDPANFRCRADLVYCLELLHNKIGRPSYRDLHELGMSMGIELAIATIGDLIGKNSKTSTSQLTWNTVERFVLACGVPEADLKNWRKAWEATVTVDRPAWQEEQERFHDRIDQLTAALAASEARIGQLAADVQKAEARAVDFEKALADRDQTQSTELFISESDLEVLNLKADARYDARDYTGAADLYEQIAEQLKHTCSPGDRRILQLQSLYLDAKTREYFCSLPPSNHVPVEWHPRPPTGEKLKKRWQELIREHRRWLPESDPNDPSSSTAPGILGRYPVVP